ncbi:3-beta hydroxysteroid dehydrogenase [Saccharibacillus sp. O23]|uniref:glucose 1-dehydrogenase n=1 Tax=Saccharibacillus sp. O23 TaxID=2009338 RepID=UPI000B4E801D|nr:glucose 1-dehydrogenase [Saccharibacillus sp. O23]OWR31894.1 3-beta hydroxysteroid dehydrogenase [Saccharibacillus sp. O23]
MNRLQGKTALITGGASGIGLASGIRFAQEGANVVLTDISDAHKNEALSQIEAAGGKAIFLRHDVTLEEDWQRVFREAEEAFGQVDVVLNNAGIGLRGNVEETSYDDWKKVIDVNLNGVFLGTKYGVIHLKKSGGSIINVSSIEGLIGDPGIAAYNASKGGVRILTKSAALHAAQYKIRVNSIHPGYIKTPMIGSDPEAMKYLTSLHPIGHLGEPEDVANMALFLASEESKFSTGSEFVVDGGYTAQ